MHSVMSGLVMWVSGSVSGSVSEVEHDLSLHGAEQPSGWTVVRGGTLVADRYRLGRPIGAGGMGQVWAARDTLLNRDVAIKLHQLDPGGSRADLERFLREARATAALQHPNVVTVYDSGIDGDQAFLVMELLPGPTLQTYVTEHDPLPEAEAVALGLQIASGLAAAHGAGVVHRDIKPSNVMFDAEGRLKIVDFGIARLTQTTATGLTITNAVIGSPPYLSPEQFQGAPADERSDLYALGCVLTTLLTGRPPFQGEHPLAYGHQHVYVNPPPISERRPDVDPDLEAMVGMLLKKDPRQRPGSALEVLQQLTAEKPRSSATPCEPTAAMPLPRKRSRRRTGFARLILAAALTPAVTAIALATGIITADTPAATPATAGQATGDSPPPAHHPQSGQHRKTRVARAETTHSNAVTQSGDDDAAQRGTARDPQEESLNPNHGAAQGDDSQKPATGQKTGDQNLTGPKKPGPKIGGPQIAKPKIGGPKVGGPTKDHPGKGGPKGHKPPQHKPTGPKSGGPKTIGSE